MSDTIRDHRTSPPAGGPTTPRSATRPDADQLCSPSLAALAETLRAAGHAVHARCAPSPGPVTHELASTAERFFEQALALSEATHSSHAHIRLYLSTQSLFLEVTQLTPKSFSRVSHDTNAQHDLDALDNWATANNHVLSVRPGPRSQLRIALMIASPDLRAGTPDLAATQTHAGASLATDGANGAQPPPPVGARSGRD